MNAEKGARGSTDTAGKRPVRERHRYRRRALLSTGHSRCHSRDV